MIILSNIDYFKELPCFNEVIEKSKIKRLKNVDLLAEQPFYEQLGIIKQIKHLVVMQCRIRLK